MNLHRRRFLTASATTLAATAAGGFFTACSDQPTPSEATESDASTELPNVPESQETEPIVEAEPIFKISLAQWSAHRALRDGTLDNLDFPKFTKETFDIEAIEWVNQFFSVEHETLGYQPKEQAYLTEMRNRLDDLGMKSVLIMCDRVGNLGDPNPVKRTAAVEGHYAWLETAKFFGCHCIRVNAASDPSLSPEKQADLCSEGLRRLSEHAATIGLSVIVENHGGLSSNGAWLAQVMKNVDLDNCGTLPDFGNFFVARNRGDAQRYEKEKALYVGDPAYTEDEYGLSYDRYLGTKELLPYAKGISAKTHDFDEQGNEIHTDYFKMMRLVKESGYRGYVGIEYEGKELSEVEGIKKSKALLKRVFAEI